MRCVTHGPRIGLIKNIFLLPRIIIPFPSRSSSAEAAILRKADAQPQCLSSFGPVTLGSQCIMSPARVLEPTEQDQQLQTLAGALEALLLTAQQLSLKEQDLQRRVRYAHDEVW